MSLQDRLKTLRDVLGMSQSAIAKATGSSMPAWQGYESGRNVPGGKVLEGLARLGVNMNWLLTGEGEYFLSNIQKDELKINDFHRKIIESSLKVYGNIESDLAKSYSGQIQSLINAISIRSAPSQLSVENLLLTGKEMRDEEMK